MFSFEFINLRDLSELEQSESDIRKVLKDVMTFTESHADVLLFEAIDVLSPRNMSFINM